MSDVHATVLRNLLIASKDGDWGSEEPPGIPTHIIRGTDFPNVRLGKVTGVPLRHLTKDSLDRRTLRPNDILIETAGGSKDRPTGRTLLLTSENLSRFSGPVTCASFARYLRIDPTLADPRYIYWYLQYLHCSGALWQHQVQHTGVARFQFTRFAETEPIPLPGSRRQEAISDLLGSLDDKIAVNARIAETAHKLAGAEYTRVSQEAVRVCVLGDAVELAYGKALPAPRRQPGPIAVYGSGGLSGWHDKRLVRGPGIVVGRKGTVGSVYWSHRDFFPIDTTYYVKVTDNQLTVEFVYFLLASLGLNEMNSDSAVPGLNRSRALAIPIHLPSGSVVAEFTDRVQPLFAIREQIASENETLTTLRDTLLSELMSGRLRVRDAEKVVEEAG
jgi:type I restriction enzyme, S subunit